MDERARHERMVRLLEARLEAIALASERAPRGERRYERQIVAVAAATRHAIELEIISGDEAGSIWSAVADRHPAAAWCRTGWRLAA